MGDYVLARRLPFLVSHPGGDLVADSLPLPMCTG